MGHWWEALLHNQSALRLKGRLLFTPGVMVASVPWQLRSSEGAAQRANDAVPWTSRPGTAGPRAGVAQADAGVAQGDPDKAPASGAGTEPR